MHLYGPRKYIVAKKESHLSLLLKTRVHLSTICYTVVSVQNKWVDTEAVDLSLITRGVFYEALDIIGCVYCHWLRWFVVVHINEKLVYLCVLALERHHPYFGDAFVHTLEMHCSYFIQ